MAEAGNSRALLVCECLTRKENGVKRIVPWQAGLGVKEWGLWQKINSHSVVILGEGRPDEITMPLADFEAFRVRGFQAVYKGMGDETGPGERFVMAVAATSDNMFGQALRDRPAETLAAIRQWRKGKK